jgi:phage terminase large subunit
MTSIELVSPYEVRDQFNPLHRRETRWFIGVAHRRAGKTVADINELVIGATRCRLANPRFAYVAPQLNQAKDIAWTYLKEYTAFLSPKINESELWVELPGGARIRIYGADNPDRLRGIYLDGVVLDEFGDMDPTIWSQVIRPALSDRKGWACFIGTPKGKNTFHKLWVAAEDDPDWTRLMLKASETGLVDDKELSRRPQDDERGRIRSGIRMQLRSCGSRGLLRQGIQRGGECRSAPHHIGCLRSTPACPHRMGSGRCRFHGDLVRSGRWA